MEQVLSITRDDAYGDGSFYVYRGQLTDGRWFWGISGGTGEIINFCPYDLKWFEMVDITEEAFVGNTLSSLEELWDKAPKERRVHKH